MFYIFSFLQISKAAYVSAVSPDCDTNTYKAFLLNLIFLYLNSEAISASHSNVVNSSNQYFVTKHE